LQDPAFRLIGSEKVLVCGAALTSRLQSFETELLTQAENLAGLAVLNRQLVAKGEAIASPRVGLIPECSHVVPLCIAGAAIGVAPFWQKPASLGGADLRLLPRRQDQLQSNSDALCSLLDPSLSSQRVVRLRNMLFAQQKSMTDRTRAVDAHDIAGRADISRLRNAGSRHIDAGKGTFAKQKTMRD